MFYRVKYLVVLFAIALYSCSEEQGSAETNNTEESNIISEDTVSTPGKVELGRVLFNDKRLSIDNTVACASCHLEAYAFTDTSRFSQGVNGFTDRNSMPLFNLAETHEFFRDGGAPSLEIQVVAPIESEVEMGSNLVDLCAELNQIEEYKTMSMQEFGTEITPFVITRSLGMYLRTIRSENSTYDRYRKGDEAAFNDEELHGLELFNGKAKCIECHNGFNLTNQAFENIGLYESYADSGRARITLKPHDSGKFRVPSLRNISLTAPYMHDGSMRTLEEVIDHFDSGGESHPLKSEIIEPLHLTDEEKDALKAFLLTLTDESYIE